MANEFDIDGFVTHTQNATQGKQLKGWKEKGSVSTFLHTKAPIVGVNYHQFPKVVTFKDKDSGEESLVVWSQDYVCTESEDVIRNQNRRDSAGKRIYPPVSCGFCKLLESVRERIAAGDLSWTDELFRFEGDDPEKTVTLHAGGICDLFKGDLTKEEIEELKKARIFRKEAWKQNARSKLHYIFRIVDADNVKDGVQIAKETGLLGDKIKIVISDKQKSLGVDEGNPKKHPYCIGWEFRPNEQEFSKKYHAYPIDRIKPSPAILDAIRGEAPSVDHLIKPYDPAEVFASLSSAATRDDLNLARFFPPGSAKPPVDVETAACDSCGKAIPINDEVCKFCGHRYDIIEEAAPPPPPPQPPKRQAAPPPAQKRQPAPPSPKPAKVEEDDIPFLQTLTYTLP